MKKVYKKYIVPTCKVIELAEPLLQSQSITDDPAKFGDKDDDDDVYGQW